MKTLVLPASASRGVRAPRRWVERALPPLALAGALALTLAMLGAEPVATPDAARGHELAQMTQRLQARLASGAEAGDAAAWALLARSHVALGEHGAAEGAYAQALRLSPMNAAWLAERAQVRVLSGARPDRDDVRKLVGLALVADAHHPLALALDGDAAYARGELPAARDRWQRALDGAQQHDGELRATLDRRIASLDVAQRALTTLSAPR